MLNIQKSSENLEDLDSSEFFFYRETLAFSRSVGKFQTIRDCWVPFSETRE